MGSWLALMPMRADPRGRRAGARGVGRAGVWRADGVACVRCGGIVRCEVCGHQTRWSVDANGRREARVCQWCYAVTATEGLHPNYEPVRSRWERAEKHGWEDHPRNAYEFFGRTLCGISGDRISASPQPWMPGWANACQACKEAAAVIDERWPPDKRRSSPIRPGFDPLVDDGPPF